MNKIPAIREKTPKPNKVAITTNQVRPPSDVKPPRSPDFQVKGASDVMVHPMQAGNDHRAARSMSGRKQHGKPPLHGGKRA